MTIAAPLDVFTPEHWHELTVGSGIPADLLAEDGVYSKPAGVAPPVPDEYFRHQNSHKSQIFPYWPAAATEEAGIVFPGWDHAGRSNPKVKLDTPRSVWDDDGNESKPKYEACGGARLSVSVTRRQRHLIDDITTPVVVVEGDKKRLAAVGALGDRYLVLGLAGVDCFTYKPNPADKTELGEHGRVRSVPLPDWDHIPMRNRIVLFLPDSDMATNQNVSYAAQRFSKMAKARGGEPIVVQLPCKPDGSKMGPDDFIVDGRDLNRHLHAAIMGALARPAPIRPSGGDGAAICAGTCPTANNLREQVREYKQADEMVRHGPFTPDGAQVVKHLVTVARATRQNGKEKQPLERSEVARLALGDASPTAQKAVSRALKAYAAYQIDPDIKATLPYTIDWRPGGRKTHIDLYPVTPDEPKTTADEYRTLSHLPRDRKPPAKVLDRDDSCRRCHSPQGVEARGVRRCLNDECGHTWHTRPVILGRTEREPDEEQTAATPTLAGRLPGQNVPANEERTYAGQNVPASPSTPSGPISFVTPSDAELADGPRYQGEAHPDDLAALQDEEQANAPKPPPLFVDEVAPDSDRTRFGRRYRADVAAGRSVELPAAFRQPTAEEYAAAVPGTPDPVSIASYLPCCKEAGAVENHENGRRECLGCHATLRYEGGYLRVDGAAS